MKIKSLTVGQLSTNCYIIYEGDECIIVDPGDEEQRILDVVHSLGLSVTYIVLTHAHFDHMGALDFIKENTDAEFALGEFEVDHYKNQPDIFNFAVAPSAIPDVLLSDGSNIPVGTSRLKVMHTPGHTVGGISLIADGFAVCGDTIFCESVGRTDFPGGNFTTELESIDKLLKLHDETVLYCGHGPSTTVMHEKKYNMFLKR